MRTPHAAKARRMAPNRSRQTDGPPMRWHRKKLGIAVSAALAASAGVASAEIETVIVTATKRAESAQDVSIALQAVTGDTLRGLGVETFDEYVDYLPNVVNAGSGPGKKEIYIRGSATEQTGVTLSSAQGSAPGVALYVDEQPVSFGGRNLDVYAVDLERIEVLSGPQGTLFGASSQSGNLRLITSKPDPRDFDAGFATRYGTTIGGADSGAADAYINVPITDALAVRAVVYSDNQGGWIDNVPATFTPSGMVVDRNNSAGFGPPLTDADSVQTARNDALVEDDWNDASYRGMRLGLAYSINDDWDLLVQHTAQTLESEGSFLIDTSLPHPNASAKFSPEHNRDEFGLTTWTLEGRIANLDLIYTGGRLTRDVDSVVDYTHYNNGGGYITYYLCSGNVYDATDVNNCYDPTKQYTENTENDRVTHEMRVTTDPSKRLRLLGGIYLNDVETHHVGEFQYASTNEAFAEHISSYYNDNSGDGFLVGNISVPTQGVNTVGPRSPFTTFFNDFTRTEEELAVFGEVAFDFTDQWGVAFSARRYDLTTQLAGAANFSFGCRYGIEPQGFGNSERTEDGRCNSHAFSNDVTARMVALGTYRATGDASAILDARSPNGARDMFRGGGSNQATLDAVINGNLDIGSLDADGSLNETDTIIKASVNFQPNDGMLLFATYSEGYRPATQNRNAGQLAVNQTGVFAGYVVPAMAVTDDLTSYELGMKGDFFSGLLRVNATWYRSQIDDLQLSRFDPSNVAFLFFIENVGDAKATGLDLDFQWAPSDALSFAGAVSLADTELTRLNPQLHGIAVPIGSELPLAPRLAGNLRARYDFSINAFDADGYLMAAVTYRGENVSGMVGSAEFMEDTLYRQTGSLSGLRMRYEGGTFGTVMIPGADGMRLPANARFVNPSATAMKLSAGVSRDGWTAELYMDNVTNEAAPVMQIAGHFTPVVSVQRPRSIGLRFSYDFE